MRMVTIKDVLRITFGDEWKPPLRRVRISTRANAPISPICILGMNKNDDKMMREKFENMEFPKA